VVLEDKDGNRVHRGAQGGRLLEDVDAVLVTLDHPRDAANLAFDARKPPQQELPIPVVAVAKRTGQHRLRVLILPRSIATPIRRSRPCPPTGRLGDVNREEWVRSELAAVACEACGNVYATSRARILARREGIYLVGLTCGSCGASAVAMISFQLEAGDAEPSPSTAAERRRQGRRSPRGPAKSAATADVDDVLDMHRFLEGFDGDFRRLFDTTLGGSSTRGRGA